MDLEKTALLSNLNALGNVVELGMRIDDVMFEEQIYPFKDSWKKYNPRKPDINRDGLSLTSLDGGMSGVPDLDSIFEYNKINGTNYDEMDFRKLTNLYEKVPALRSVVDPFKDGLGRSHIIRFNQGGFFPPHRDGYGDFNEIRILVPLLNCDQFDYEFIVDRQLLNLRQWKAYYINTMITHSFFSYVNNCMILVLNVELTYRTYHIILDSLAQR